MKDHNFLTIPAFFRTKLDLKGIDLLIVSVIYGFSQDGETEFCGSAQYIADWCGADKKSVRRHLQALVQAGIIIKREVTIGGVKFCRYRFNHDLPESGGKNVPGRDKMSPGGGDKMSPNNIDGDNIDISKDPLSRVEKSGEPSFSAPQKKNGCPENSERPLDAERKDPNPPVAPVPPSPVRFRKPTMDEVAKYIRQRGLDIDAEMFWNFYESKGWTVGKSPMKNWHAAAAMWRKRQEKQAYGNNHRWKDRRGDADFGATCADDYRCGF